MSSLLDKYRQFKLDFYEKVFGRNVAENHLLDKDNKRSIIKTREQYFDIASLLIFYSLYGLTNNLSAAVHKQQSIHATPKPKPKLKSNSNLSSSGHSDSDSSNSHDAAQAEMDSKPIESKANPQYLIDADFIVASVLTIAELDEILDAKVKVAIPVLTEVVTGQFDSVFIEPFSPITKLVSARLDLSDIVSFSVLQDSMPVHQIWISGAVQMSVTEGGLLVSANALANALASIGVLSVVNLPAILPAGVSYDAGTASFSFNPNDAAYNQLAEGQILSLPVAYKVSDGTVEVDASVIFQITGVNDVPIVTGDFVGELIEAGGLDNAILGGPSATGRLFSDDVDEGQSNRFQVKVFALSDKAWGWYSVDANGHWTYSLDNNQPDVQALATGMVGSDSFTIKTVDGTERQIQVFITGTDDLALLSSALVSLDETNAVLSTLGVLTISDFDSRETFVAQEATVGAYGVFTLTASGAWNYTANSAFDNLVVGQQMTDSFAVKSSDGASTYVTVTITGTNDAASISGTSTAALTESNAALSASGTLTISDVDSEETFIPQTDVAGDNDFGTFNINASGNWTYSAGAHNELTVGQEVTDSVTVASVDGTATQMITVTITGTNDAATISGTSTAALTESDEALSASGSLSVADLDAGETVFVPQTDVAGSHGFGIFSINAAGQWTYSAGAHDELTAGQKVTDSVTVASVDGTATQLITVTITGVNDSASITGDISSQVVADNLSNQLSGMLIADDPDTGESGFKPETLISVFGELIIDESGDWTYSVFSDLSAEQVLVIQQLGEGDSIPDVFTVQSIDGTKQDVSINIFGINDPAEISVSASGETNQGVVTEGSSVPAAGHISITDLDPGEASFIEQTVTTDYGIFTLTANGDWSYTLNLDNADVKHLVSGEFLNDYFEAMSFDGSAHESITITINGIDDALILDGPSYSLVVTDDIDVPQSNTVNTGSDLLQAFNLINPEQVTDVVASWSFDQQKTTDYGILYLDSASGLYEFVPNKDAIQTLSSKLLLLVDINIINNGNIIPTNIVITLNNSSVSNDLFAGVEVTELNFSDVIDLSSLNAQYNIEDANFKHGPEQDNYLVIDDTPVVDVVDLAHLSVLIDGYSYHLSI